MAIESYKKYIINYDFYLICLILIIKLYNTYISIQLSKRIAELWTVFATIPKIWLVKAVWLYIQRIFYNDNTVNGKCCVRLTSYTLENDSFSR